VENYLQISEILYVPGMDKLSFQLDRMDLHRVRVIITYLGHELGVLYFERVKQGFNLKPIGMNSWACVDAKIEGLYEYGGEHITPKDIVAHCQKLISSGE
jgi:hypothetical protein